MGVEPSRVNPSRLAKHTEKGKLGAAALGQRTVGSLCCQEKKKPQAMQVDEENQ